VFSAVVGFKRGKGYYNDPEIDETHTALRNYIKHVKKDSKRKQTVILPSVKGELIDTTSKPSDLEN
jgi:hypothetical protein